ncbi:MAG TPA: hypothetical protein VGY55_14775 [Pirellulales bacterium]|jgi:hypothetical protein|nr:hypothetical protein [Pirellulales bacterium]
MSRRFQFPLYKVFLIIAVFALTIRMAQYFGPEDWPLAAPFGAVASLLVVFMNRRNAVDAILTAVVALMGAFIGWQIYLHVFEGDGKGQDPTSRGFTTLAALLAGTLAGAVFALFLQWISDHLPTR